MNKLKLFFIYLGHFLSFPLVFLYLFILIKLSKNKYLTYESEQEDYKESARYEYVYKIAKATLFIANIKVDFVNVEILPQKPLFFVSNHKSLFDALIFLKLFYKNPNLTYPVFVAKQELENDKKIGFAAKLIDSIFIDRKNLRSIFECLQKQKQVILKKSLVVFPETTRYPNDEIGEFKSAAFECPYSTLTSIVPVVIYGLANLDIEKSKKDFFKYKKVTFKILSLVKQKDFISYSKDYFSSKIQEKINSEYEILKNKDTKNK